MKKYNSFSKGASPVSFKEFVDAFDLDDYEFENKVELALDNIFDRLTVIEDQLKKIRDKQSGHFLDH